MLPAAAYLDTLKSTLPGSQGALFLDRYRPAPVSSPTGSRTARIQLSPPELVQRALVSEQVDWQPDTSWRFQNRVAISRFSRPQFAYSPYPDFISGLTQNGTNVAFMATRAKGPDALEIRALIGLDSLKFGRAHPEIPSLTSDDQVVLPGANYVPDYSQQGSVGQFIGTAMHVEGRHVLKAGGEFLVRSQDVSLDALQGGYQYPALDDFLAGTPRRYSTGLSRLDAISNRLVKPSPVRRYRYSQGGLFVQDSYQPVRRLTLQFGGRLEYLGQPLNIGSQMDTVLQFATESDFSQRLNNAHLGLSATPMSGQSIRAAGRLGFAFSLSEGTVVRGGYGDYYDPAFDNLWLNVTLNQYVLGEAGMRGKVIDFLTAPAELYSLDPQSGRIPMTASNFRRLLAFGPSLRAPHAGSYFAAVQQALSPRWVVEVSTVGTTGRKLLTTDIVNRPFFNGSRRVSPRSDLPEVNYRDSEGNSHYHGMAWTARYRGPRASFQASYTWSHSIDNQSDPLEGDFDFLFTQTSGAVSANGNATFSRQRDFRADRGSSDFDQRHNFVILSTVSLPALFTRGIGHHLFGGWAFSQIAAVRSGTPFSVTGEAPSALARETIYNNRANSVACPSGYSEDLPLTQGRQLLNPACFSLAKGGQPGSTGRNAFVGPGSANLDVSISKTFVPRRGPEGSRIVIRADAYNTLNHANLNSPESNLLCSRPADCGGAIFGVAQFGKKEGGSAFPALKPFVESGRQIQLLLRYQF